MAFKSRNLLGENSFLVQFEYLQRRWRVYKETTLWYLDITSVVMTRSDVSFAGMLQSSEDGGFKSSRCPLTVSGSTV